MSLTEEEALEKLDRMKLPYPYQVETKYGPALVSKVQITPELAAELMPHEAAFRRKHYTVKQDPQGRWFVALWTKLIFTTPRPEQQEPAPEPVR